MQTFPVEAIRLLVPCYSRCPRNLTSNAGKISGHFDGEVDDPVLCCRLSDSQIRLAVETIGVPLEIHIASVWSSTIVIDLVDSNSDLASRFDRSDSLGEQLSLGLLTNINVTSQQSPSALVDDIGGDLIQIDDIGVIGCEVDLEWQAGRRSFVSLRGLDDTLGRGD